MEKYVIVGVGGTGSYVTNALVHYLKGSKNKTELILVDGDILEEKNLLRQGFLKRDLEKNKAEALCERYSRIADDNLSVFYVDSFIENTGELEDIIGESDKVTLISCVDNNMARLRIILTQYKWFYENRKEIHFIDGGNEEWEGQVLINKIAETDLPPLIFKGGKVRYNEDTEHANSLIFKGNKNWKNSLSVGDFELSCEDVTESAPQNILANMTSAAGIMERVYDRKDVRFQFDVSKAIQEEYSVGEKENSILEEIAEYVNVEGKDLIKEVTKEVIKEIEEEDETAEDEEEQLMMEFLNSLLEEDNGTKEGRIQREETGRDENDIEVDLFRFLDDRG